MLSEEALERLSERLVNRIEDLNLYMIKKLASQINTIGEITPSQLNQVYQAVKYGSDFNDIINKVSQITEINVKDIYSMFEEVAKKNQEYSKKFYEYTNTSYIPYESNQELKKQVKAIADITVNEYINMSNTMAYMFINENGVKEYSSLSDTYQRITDEAILNIVQGRESYEMAMKKAMKELTTNGLRTVDYSSGYSRRMDSSVRMNIKDGLRQLTIQLQEQFGEEFGADGIEVSHHINSAPDHIDTIDGKQFSKNGDKIVNGKKYKDFDSVNNELDRHVGELNCYHFTYSIILGVDEPRYSKEELKRDKEANREGFEFKGKHYTNYEGTQLQRSLETKIRQYKDRQIGAKSINDTDEVYHCQEKIDSLTKEYKELSDVSGLPTKVDRLRVEGYRKVSSKVKPQTDSLIYEDITDTWLNKTGNHYEVQQLENNFVYKGNTYKIDGHNVKYEFKKGEKEFAKWLSENSSKKLTLLPKINVPEGIKTPDYLIDNEYFDYKYTTGSSNQLIFHNLEKNEKQSKNFIIEINNEKIDMQNIYNQVNNTYRKLDWVEKIAIKKDKKFVIFNKKQQKRK